MRRVNRLWRNSYETVTRFHGVQRLRLRSTLWTHRRCTAMYGRPHWLFSTMTLRRFAHPMHTDAATNTGLELPTYCTGCGARLQFVDEHEVGYTIVPRRIGERSLDETSHDVEVEEAELEKESESEIVCQRCFSLRHHGRASQAVFVDNDSVERMLAPVRERACVVCVVVDLLDIDGTLLNELHEYVGIHAQVVVAVNKRDVLPTGATDTRVERWTRERMRQWPLRERVRRVHAVSARTGDGLTELLRSIEEVRVDVAAREATTEPIDVFVVGCTNCGKSTLINRLLSKLDLKAPPLTTSALPGTTLQLRSFEWPEAAAKRFVRHSPAVPRANSTVARVPPRLVDTPGIGISGQFIDVLPATDVARVTAHRRIVPHAYRVRAGKSLLLGGVARIDIEAAATRTDDNHLVLLVFADPRVSVHDTSIERAADVRERLGADGRLAPPFDASAFARIGALRDARHYRIVGTDMRTAAADIALPSLAWIAVHCVGTVSVRVHVAGAARAHMRESALMPFELRRRVDAGIKRTRAQRDRTWIKEKRRLQKNK